jgi:hypothetical protein
MRAQSAIEFLSIVSMGLILLAVVSGLGYDYFTGYFRDVNPIKTTQTINRLMTATNLVYTQGVGSQTKVILDLPPGIIINRTYLDKKEINIRYESSDGTKDALAVLPYNISGTLPTREGPAVVYATLSGDGTVIKMDANISSITIKLYNSTGSEKYNFTTGNTIRYNITLSMLNGTAINGNITIRIFRPNMTNVLETSVQTSGGYYSNTYTLPAGSSNGYWLFSVMEKINEGIGTKLFYKY